jgi:glycosyltransferase involved in cell wall biosynthesis
VFGLAQNKQFPLSVVFRFVENFIYRRADYVTVLSNHEYEHTLAKGSLTSNKISIVSMSIDVGRFTANVPQARRNIRKKMNIPPESFVVGMIGRLTMQKDPASFVKAAAILDSKITNCHFLWVGDGDMKREVLQMAGQEGLNGKFVISGNQSSADIPAFLAAIDVVLFTSRFEGLPIVLLEAMAAKKLIVAADVGCVGDVIREDTTGWLFDRGDYEKAAARVYHLSQNIDGYEHIKQTAFDLVERDYSPQTRIANEFEVIYERLWESQMTMLPEHIDTVISP